MRYVLKCDGYKRSLLVTCMCVIKPDMFAIYFWSSESYTKQNISKDAPEMSLSGSTAFPRHQRKKRWCKTMTKQTAHMKTKKMVREKSRECHNHKSQTFRDSKRNRKPTKPKKHKSNKRTISTKISYLFPKQGNRNAKRAENTRTK